MYTNDFIGDKNMNYFTANFKIVLWDYFRIQCHCSF